jgi:hypothetical protein
VLSLQWTTIRTPPVRAWGSRNPQQEEEEEENKDEEIEIEMYT